MNSRSSGQKLVHWSSRNVYAPQSRNKISNLKSCFIHIFLLLTEFLFIQGASVVYTSRFLGTDYLSMALCTRKVSGTFEKQTPAPIALDTSVCRALYQYRRGQWVPIPLKPEFVSGFFFTTASLHTAAAPAVRTAVKTQMSYPANRRDDNLFLRS